MKLLMLASLAIFFFSCNTKEENMTKNGEAIVSLDVSSSEVDDSSPVLFASNKRDVMTNEIIGDKQTFTLPFDNENIIEFSLESTNQSNNISSLKKRAAVARYPINNNTNYRVVVYDKDGKYITQKQYATGVNTGSSNDTIKLIAGQTYSFLFLSYNSTSNAPAQVSSGNLSTQTYTVRPAPDLMHVLVKNVTLKEGNNLVQAVLKHHTAQITTNIDATKIGVISNIQNVRFTPHHVSATLALNTGVLTSHTPITPTFTSASFPAGTGMIKTSTPTYVFANNSNNGTLQIGSITVAGTTKSNLQVTGLTFESGKRYTLNIKFKSPEELTSNLIWATGNVLFTPTNSSNETLGGRYSIAPAGEVGSYFPGADVGGPRKFPVTTKVNATDYLLYDNNPIVDPCSLLPAAVAGKPWRAPTQEELKELTLKSFVARSVNGKPGALFNNVIFFPFSGWMPIRPGATQVPEQNIVRRVTLDSEQGFYSGTNSANLFFGQTDAGWYSSVPAAPWSSTGRPEAYKSGRPIRCVRAI